GFAGEVVGGAAGSAAAEERAAVAVVGDLDDERGLFGAHEALKGLQTHSALLLAEGATTAAASTATAEAGELDLRGLNVVELGMVVAHAEGRGDHREVALSGNHDDLAGELALEFIEVFLRLRSDQHRAAAEHAVGAGCPRERVGDERLILRLDEVAGVE